MRDNIFLQNKLEQIWKDSFWDVPKLNSVIIIFKGK